MAHRSIWVGNGRCDHAEPQHRRRYRHLCPGDHGFRQHPGPWHLTDDQFVWNGSGTVAATANSVLTIGNPQSQTMPDSTFNGALTGTSLSVIKAGTGTLTLGGSTSNTLSGSSGLAVNSGTLVLAKTGGAVAVSSKLIIGTVGASYGSATSVGRGEPDRHDGHCDHVCPELSGSERLQRQLRCP